MSIEQNLQPHPSLSDQAFEAIATAISRGELEPGSRLKEAVIARNLGISRGTLREAIRRLESQHLIERRQNLGAYVTALTEEDLDDLFQMREVLEGRAAGLAAGLITDAQLEELSLMVQRHGSTVSQTGNYHQLRSDDDFHFSIIRTSGSRRLFRALCDELYLQIRMYRIRSASRPGRSETALSEHREILEALAARDGKRAEDAMRNHIATARKNLLWAGASTTNP